MPKRFIDPALFGLGCLVLLIWHLSDPVFAQAPAKNALNAKSTLSSGTGMSGASTQSDLASKKVLILHSYTANSPVNLETDKGLSYTLDSGGIPNLNQFFVSLDLMRTPSSNYRKLLVEQVRTQYSHSKPDMIITVLPEALEFVRKDCKDIFPDVPVLALYNYPNLEVPKTDRRIIKHYLKVDIIGTLDIALKLVTGTKKVYVVSGAHEIDKSIEDQARLIFKKWEGQIEFFYLSHMPFDDILAAVSNARGHSIVLFLTFIQDVSGRNYFTPYIVEQLSRVSTAPLFGVFDAGLGHGVVGGSLNSYELIGNKAGQLTLDVLGSPDSSDIPAVLDVSPVPMFDWRQLRHWNLSETALPKGSVVINKELTLWDLRYHVMGVLAFCLAESALILFLIVQRRRKRVAEESLRKAEEKYRSLFEGAVEGIFETSPQGKPLTASPALARILGYSTPEEFLTSVHETANEVWVNPNERAEYVRLLEGGNVALGYECQFWRKNRTKVWVSLSGRRVCGPDGQTLLYSGFIEDITERKQAEEALKERLQFEQLLSGLSARFVNMPPDRVDAEIEYGLRQILEFFQVDHCALIRTLPGKASYQITHIASSDDVPPVPVRVELPRSIYPWAYEKLTEKNEVVSISRPDDLPAEANVDRQTCMEWGIRSYVNIPILIGEFVDHIIHVSSVKSERVWPEELFPRLRLLGEIFVNALQRKRAEEASRESERILRQNESDLRNLAGRLIYAQEEERRRLARELHDDLAQRLAVFAIDVGRLEQQLIDPPAPVREDLRELQNSIVGISQDVHNLSRQLHPSILDDLGLIKAAESECTGFSRREGIEVVFNHENFPRGIPKDVSLSLYRIIQEGLRNISKHACAEHISVSLKGLDHDLLLSVQDDGIGFDWAEVKENPGLGFSSMRERARLIHGELSIHSQPEKGTVITLRVPLRREGE